MFGAVAAAGVLLAVALAAFGSPQAAFAQQSPPGCFANSLATEIGRDPQNVSQGSTLEYAVVVRNNVSGGTDACDLTGADVDFVEPAADGTPTGTVHNLATGVNFPADGSGDLCVHSSTAPAFFACPAGTTETINEALSYVVNVNEGVVSVTGGVVVTGDRPPTDACPAGAASLHDGEPPSDACAAATVSANFQPATPTPTAVVVSQTPSPTPTALAVAAPIALPSTGGDPDSSGVSGVVLAIAGAAIVLACGASATVVRRRIG
jgi:hypothetical protein